MSRVIVDGQEHVISSAHLAGIDRIAAERKETREAVIRKLVADAKADAEAVAVASPEPIVDPPAQPADANEPQPEAPAPSRRGRKE